MSITISPANPSASANATFAWAGSDDVTHDLTRSLAVAAAVRSGNLHAGHLATYTALTDGSYTFHVIAKDSAGNVAPRRRRLHGRQSPRRRHRLRR